MDSTRDELVGFCTLAAMSLLGTALYSGTYSLIYASMGAVSPPVAILEMWFTSVHLVVGVGCCVLQATYLSLFKKIMPHLADAQTALLLGIACAVTILGNNCMRYGECTAYYGAASFPRVAAAGSIAWAWVMYAASLTCQSWVKGGVTLGFNDKQGVTAASVMIMLICTVASKLSTTCGWPSVDGTTPILFVLGGLVLIHLGTMVMIRVLGSLVFLCAFFIVGRWDVYSITALALGANALLAEVWRSSARTKKTHKHK